MKYWIKAARLRTLPLSLSGIILGSLIALADGHFDFIIFLLAIFTTVFLQVLSNFANDYGDGIKGTDKNRTGEKRMVSSGFITPSKMKKAVILFSTLSFLSATFLLIISFVPEHIWLFFIFIGLAISSVVAAILYTVGRHAYGYRAMGDIFVYIFFGLVAVMGTYTLYAKNINLSFLLPASSIGFLSTAVLNLNNMRDIEQDKLTHKNTIPIYIGFQSAKIYHFLLMFMPFVFSLIYVGAKTEIIWTKYLFLILIFPTSILWLKVWKTSLPKELDKELKFTALLTLAFAILLGLGLNIG